jgi:hypothetical protein
MRTNDGKRPQERSRRRCEDILKKRIFKKEHEGDGVDWCELAQDWNNWGAGGGALVNAVVNLRVP